MGEEFIFSLYLVYIKYISILYDFKCYKYVVQKGCEVMVIQELALDVKNISKKRGKKTILKDVTFSIEKGEVCGFVGRNGAGKTTLMKIITNMLFPDKG